ncbi:sulfatase [Pseudonocardia sp. DSM 110487]|uniref:sulfatase family protein n=1 Tax=Pseudonocardia sp. DSM 110487 TaxID=2865833 RepID=UPI001C69BBFF|nr:sulfatase [Pseudonocardia sp. DSM 110487]QYN39362.1 sulfatase [Pseudonocardia sp. DSM 110487]
MNGRKPNVLIVLTDEWRAQATGYAGDANARTPRLDALAAESIDFENAVAGAPVCCPARASLLTGQYPLQHGVYINDVELRPTGPTLGEILRDTGYRTGYIGKWHLYGSPDGHYGRRGRPVPPDRHFGFEYWKAAECCHDYNESFYYEGADPRRRYWAGYDADDQTADACRFIAEQGDDPYALVVAYGPPHFPLHTAPPRYRALYEDAPIALRPNVTDDVADTAVAGLRGYYAHIAALDDCVGRLLDAVERSGSADDTIVVFTSDHGDMMGSQGVEPNVKVFPWEESVRIPLLVRHPARFGRAGRKERAVFDWPDFLPTLLGLCDIPVPDSVTGTDALHSPRSSAFLSMPVPIFLARTYGIGEYRGVRTARYTYVRSLAGPWLLYDNRDDPYQLRNEIDNPAFAAIRQELDAELDRWLDRLGDEFLPAHAYLRRDGLLHYSEVNNPVGRSSGPRGQWSSTMDVVESR